jgi:hypothetical protein
MGSGEIQMHHKKSASYRRLFINKLLTVSVVGTAIVGAGMSVAAEEEQKIAELLPVAPLAVSETGNIFSRLVGMDDIFAWDPVAKTQTPIFQSSEQQFTGSLSQLDINADATIMSIQHSINVPPYTGIKVVELGKSGFPATTIPETRVMSTGVPKLSPDGQYTAFAGRLDQSGGAMSLWIFNLTEYLYDAEQGSAQPTGFYMESVQIADEPDQEDQPIFRGRSFSSSNVNAVAWSPDSTKIAFVVSSFGRAGSGTSLRIYDLATRKTEDLGAFQAVNRIDWVSDDSIYYQGFSGGAALFRFDTVKKTTESIVGGTLDPNTLSFSSNGKYLSYSTVGAKALVLRDIEGKADIKVEGAQSLRFSRDGRTVVLQRSGLDPQKKEAPFFVASFSEVLDAAVEGKVVLSKLGLTTAGVSVPSFAPPKERAAFEQAFKWDQFTVNSNVNYISASGLLKNQTSNYYTFKWKGWDYARCRVYDEQGKLLAQSPVNPTNPTDPEQRILMGGKKQQQFYCSVFMATPLTFGTKIKVVMELKDYETASSIEKETTL